MALHPEDSALHRDDIPLLVGADGLEREQSLARPQLRRAVSKWSLIHEEEEGFHPYKHEAWRLLQLAVPLASGSFFSYALSLLAVAFIGRLSEAELSISVLATSIFNVTAIAVIIGFVGALETVAGQAFGAHSYRACGVALQRCIMLSLLICAAVALCWTQMGWALAAIGQDPGIAAGAARYLHLAIPSMVFVAMFESIKRYLQAKGIVHPATIVSCITLLLAPLVNWLLIFKLRLGLDGAALAMNACQLSNLVLLSAYTVRHHASLAGSERQTWHGWSREALTGWGAFMSLGVPSTVMVCLEWWAYEATTLLSGLLPNPELHVSAMGVAHNLSGMLYMSPMGFASACSVRVSNALGAGLPHAARRTALTAAAMVFCNQLTLATALAIGRGAWARIFTSVPEVVATAGSLMPILAVTMFGDGINAVLGGMLRGAGRQELGALLMLGTFWGIGIPLGALLCFKAYLGVRGLWGGLAIASTIQGGLMLIVMSRFNWHEEARKAAARVVAADKASEDAGFGGGGGGSSRGEGKDEGGSSGSRQEAAELALAERGGSVAQRPDSASVLLAPAVLLPDTALRDRPGNH